MPQDIVCDITYLINIKYRMQTALSTFKRVQN